MASVEDENFDRVIASLFENRDSLDIEGNYGKGLPINPSAYETTSCGDCASMFPHDDCSRVPLAHPRYVFGIGPGDGDYGILTWTPNTLTLEREGVFQETGGRRIYRENPTVTKVLKDIKKLCIRSGPQYSDEYHFPDDAFVVIPIRE